MSRQYTHVRELLCSVLVMKGEGCTLREIANHFGLSKEQIKELCKRERRKERKTKVWINQKSVGTHKGDYTFFRFDITDALRAGENEITVCAQDDDTRSLLSSVESNTS